MDDEIKKILRRLYNLKYHKEKLKDPAEQDESYNNVVVSVFNEVQEVA